ncbi:MAG TPA: hypothetical protein VIU85_08435 [Chthoniobacterales bacterium]
MKVKLHAAFFRGNAKNNEVSFALAAKEKRNNVNEGAQNGETQQLATRDF